MTQSRTPLGSLKPSARRLQVLAAAALSLALVAGCSSDDDPQDGASQTGAAGETQSPGATTPGAEGQGDATKEPPGSSTGEGDDGPDDDGSPDGDGGGDGGGDNDKDKDKDKGDGSKGDDGDGGSSDAPQGGDGANDATSPFVVAAAAVAQRSRDQVITLHAMGVATTNRSEIPKEAIPATGKQIRGALKEQVAESTRLTPPKRSPAAALVKSLREYGQLASDLESWKPKGPPLSKGWFTKLAATDRTWKTALEDLSKLSGEDLLADLPELLMPADQ